MTDVTHVRWNGCTRSAVGSYTGKERFPTITYKVTVDHSGRAIPVTEVFAGAQNDETIVFYDLAVQVIRSYHVQRQNVLYRGRGWIVTRVQG